MHRSRLAGLSIDCRTDDLDRAADFWTSALGMPIKRPAESTDPNYVTLNSAARDLYVEVQRVDHDSRVHIDIEADDIEAEAVRLEGLGARRVGQVSTWLVMEAPTGQRFCIVRGDRDKLAKTGNRWD